MLYITNWSLGPMTSLDAPKLQRYILQWIRLSASARPPVLCLGTEHQNVLGNITIFLDGHNYNKQKQRLRIYPTIIRMKSVKGE